MFGQTALGSLPLASLGGGLEGHHKLILRT